MKKDARSIKNRLLQIGEKQYNFGRIGIFRILPITIGLVLAFLICQFLFAGDFGTFLEAFAFEFGMAAGLQAIVVIAIYLGVVLSIVSVPLYFFGLHYLGLGQISENTEK